MSPRPKNMTAAQQRVKSARRAYYEIEASRRMVYHTYRKRIEIDDSSEPIAYAKAKKIAETAARRGYDVRVYKHMNDAAGRYFIALELTATILPPWGR